MHLDPEKRIWQYDGQGNKVLKNNYNHVYTGVDREKVLTILMEECGELVQRASKMIRHGVNTRTVADLNDEAGDVLTLIDILISENILDPQILENRKNYKITKLITRGYLKNAVD